MMSHRMTNTRLYVTWCNMKRRCLGNAAPKVKSLYFDRGIRVCDEWQQFIPFRDWAILAGYSDALEIDRKDNDKGYGPDNCRWVTETVQSRNRRKERGRTSTFKGVAWHAASKKWQARISVDKVLKHLGVFTNEKDAAAAYVSAAKKFF